MLFAEEREITRANLITVLPKLWKTYNVSFEVKPKTFSQTRSVLQLTIGGNYGAYGDRTPGLWFDNDELLIKSAVNGTVGYGYGVKLSSSSTKVKENQWSIVEVSQRLRDGKYHFEIKVDGELLHSVENSLDQRNIDPMCWILPIA